MKSRKVLFSLVLALVLCMTAGVAMAAGTGSDLQKLIDNAADGATISLTQDYVFTGNEGEQYIFINKNLTIEGNGHTISNPGTNANVSRMIRINNVNSSGYTVTFSNVKLVNSAPLGRCVETRGGANTVNFVNSKVITTGSTSQPITVGGKTTATTTINVNGTTVDAGNSGYAIITFNKSNINITDNSTVKGYGLVYLKGATNFDGKDNNCIGSSNSVVMIKNSTLDSTNNVANYASNSFSSIVIENSNNVDVSITDSTVISHSLTGNDQRLVGIKTGSEDATITVSGDSVIKGELMGADGDSDVSESKLIPEGGTFTHDPTAYTGNTPVAQIGSSSEYVVGKNNIESAVTSSNTTVTVISGSADLYLPVGTTIVNKTANAILVNGNALFGFGTTTVQPADLKNRTPQTGDESNIALWISLMALSAAAFVVLGRKTRFN